MTEQLKQAIADVQDLARNGSRDEKIAFVEWISEALAYNSYQGNAEAVANLKAQYQAYLEELNNIK